jgi:hypothetical protein
MYTTIAGGHREPGCLAEILMVRVSVIGAEKIQVDVGAREVGDGVSRGFVEEHYPLTVGDPSVGKPDSHPAP